MKSNQLIELVFITVMRHANLKKAEFILLKIKTGEWHSYRYWMKKASREIFKWLQRHWNWWNTLSRAKFDFDEFVVLN